MKQNFNFNRLMLLIRRQALERGKLYLMTLIIIAVVMLFFYTYNFWFWSNGVKSEFYSVLNFREPLFSIFGVFFISISASHYFTQLGDKAKAIYDLTFPASRLEKYIVATFFSVVLTILSFILIFMFIDWAFISYYGPEHAKINNYFIDGKFKEFTAPKQDFYLLNYMINTNSKFGLLATFGLGFALCISSVFLLGSVYFNRFQYIKTWMSVNVFIAIMGTGYALLIRYLFVDKIYVGGYNPLENNNSVWYAISLIYILALFFYFVAYQRYKEKEV